VNRDAEVVLPGGSPPGKPALRRHAEGAGPPGRNRDPATVLRWTRSWDWSQVAPLAGSSRGQAPCRSHRRDPAVDRRHVEPPAGDRAGVGAFVAPAREPVVDRRRAEATDQGCDQPEGFSLEGERSRVLPQGGSGRLIASSIPRAIAGSAGNPSRRPGRIRPGRAGSAGAD